MTRVAAGIGVSPVAGGRTSVTSPCRALAEDVLELGLGVVEAPLALSQVGGGVLGLALSPVAQAAHVAALRQVERNQQDGAERRRERDEAR